MYIKNTQKKGNQFIKKSTNIASVVYLEGTRGEIAPGRTFLRVSKL